MLFFLLLHFYLSLLLLRPLWNRLYLDFLFLALLSLWFGRNLAITLILRPRIILVILLRLIVYINTKLLFSSWLHRHLVCQTDPFKATLSGFSWAEIPRHKPEVRSIQNFWDISSVSQRHDFVVWVNMRYILSFRVKVFGDSLSCISVLELN